MCSQHHAYHTKRRRHRSVGDEKGRFYRHLRSFVAFNFIVPAIWILTGDFNGLWKVSLIWGIILFIKSIKLFGVPGTDGWLSRDFEVWAAERHDVEPLEDLPDAEPLFDQSSPRERSSWRDRDLV